MSRIPYLLALDPSFTATGWVVVDIQREAIVDGGVIRTAKAKKTERLTASEDGARRCLVLARALTEVLDAYRPMAAALEGAAGSMSAPAASALGRAQATCACTLGLHECEPALMYFTQQAVKKTATGRNSASKAELEAYARERWRIDSDEIEKWDALLEAPPLQGGHPPPPGLWENAFDASCVAATAWTHPTVALLRELAA